MPCTKTVARSFELEESFDMNHTNDKKIKLGSFRYPQPTLVTANQAFQIQ
jgi:hypothetical protein